MFSLSKHDVYDVNEFIEEYFTNAFKTNASATKAYSRTTDEQFELWIDIPGVKKNAISLSIENDMLHISASRYDIQGKHERRISIDRKYDSDSAEAKLEDGVLYIKMPVRSSQKATKTIQIK